MICTLLGRRPASVRAASETEAHLKKGPVPFCWEGAIEEWRPYNLNPKLMYQDPQWPFNGALMPLIVGIWGILEGS